MKEYYTTFEMLLKMKSGEWKEAIDEDGNLLRRNGMCLDQESAKAFEDTNVVTAFFFFEGECWKEHKPERPFDIPGRDLVGSLLDNPKMAHENESGEKIRWNNVRALFEYQNKETWCATGLFHESFTASWRKVEGGDK